MDLLRQKRKINRKKLLVAIAAISGVMMLCAPMAVMANSEVSYGEGNVQVETFDEQDTVSKAFCIFKAKKNEDGTLSDFAWPSDEMRNTVVGVIRQFTSSYSSLDAQDAADYISAAVRNVSGELITDQNTILQANELLNKLAAAADDVDGAVVVSKGQTVTLPEGYWLLVTANDSIDMDESGTSPIFTIIGGGSVTVTEKRSVPSIDKQILNDADGAVWQYGADAQRGQDIRHQITGTVAMNIQTYDLYYYGFEDVMSRGIDYNLGSYKVTIDGKDVSSSFREALTQQVDGTRKLEVICEDLYAIPNVHLNADSKIILTYSVKLNDDCVIGASGNPNEACIFYSSNPNTREIGKTHTVKDYLYAFALHLEKKDRDTNVSLPGARFMIMASTPDDASSEGLFVQQDGRLGTAPYEFRTGKDGSFEVAGLDAGSYLLKEVQAPDMYQIKNEDTIVTIRADYGEDGSLQTLTNVVSGNTDAAAGIDSKNDYLVNGDADSAAIAARCLVNVTVGNIKKVQMPLSGEPGLALIIALGLGITAISAAGIIFRGKKKESKK
ncbi:MAG: isopeptide-forming domain-containing fimbrial protein [Lachnospiraceae bacterium]|nr:isopeptide-forming domain-containing fimbrial protein [Lachnospiraceae bacterium]